MASTELNLGLMLRSERSQRTFQWQFLCLCRSMRVCSIVNALGSPDLGLHLTLLCHKLR
jgi:hypothetical protein